MNVYGIIVGLLKERNVSMNKLLTSCGISTGVVSQWKEGRKPSADALIKISEYLNVSVDYILGKEKPKSVSMGMSIARGGEVRHYKLSDERLKFLQQLAETMEKEDRQ